MTRELLILRHGKSDWEAGTDDFHRPLKDRGKRAAQRMAVHLQQRDLLPDHVLSSPAERAVETARKACKAMGLTAGDVHTDGRIYAAGPESLIEALGDSPADARRVLLVGHNPGLEELLGYLAETTPPLPPDGKLLPTATLARLEMPDDWRALQPGCGRLVELVRPGGLPKKFPFPAPDGPELRDRPAYYYIQSSVIPYRLNDGRLEILIIASSKNKHSVVPKGIQDPGHTPQASAAKEAWEEGGVEGVVAEEPLGSYRYDKWGAECTVTVYPMEVSRMVPEAEWEERHRGREWVSSGEAAARLKQRALAPMVQALAEQLTRKSHQPASGGSVTD